MWDSICLSVVVGLLDVVASWPRTTIRLWEFMTWLDRSLKLCLILSADMIYIYTHIYTRAGVVVCVC